MAQDGEKNCVESNAIVPANRNVLDQLQLAKAQSEANIAQIKALGEQIKTLVESPGVKTLLEDAGRALVQRIELEKLRLEKDHEFKMQADQLEKQRQSQREKLGVVVVTGGALCALLALIGMGILIEKQVITKETAIVIGGFVASLLTGMGLGRRSKAQ